MQSQKGVRKKRVVSRRHCEHKGGLVIAKKYFASGSIFSKSFENIKP